MFFFLFYFITYIFACIYKAPRSRDRTRAQVASGLQKLSTIKPVTENPIVTQVILGLRNRSSQRDLTKNQHAADEGSSQRMTTRSASANLARSSSD